MLLVMAHPKQIQAEEILLVAIKTLEENGAEALSLRHLAQQCGVKAPSLYRYYKDRAALEHAIVAAGSNALRLALDKTRNATSPQEHLEKFASSYLHFARSRNALYRFMMEQAPEPDTSEAGLALWKLVVSAVSAHTGRPDDTAAAVAFWAYLHGFASLELSGRFGKSGPRGGFSRGLQALLRTD